MGIFNERIQKLISGNKGIIKEDNRLELQEQKFNRIIENEKKFYGTQLANTNTQVALKILDYGSNDELAAQEFFKKVYGYEDLKYNLYSALTAEEQTNTLLFGPPASAKSLFMKIIEQKCNDVLYFDSSNASGAGLIEALYNHQNAKIVLIDEIGMLNKNDLDALRGVLNDGRVIKTLKKKRYDFTMNCKIFATTNDMDFSAPIISRFQSYELAEYTDEEFIKVSQFCLADKFNVEVAGMIAAVLLANRKKDIRQVLNVSRLIKASDNEDQITKKIETTIKYSVSSNATDYN